MGLFILSDEEQRLWAIVEPYMVHCKLVDDAPPEVVATNDELTRMAWDWSWAIQ